MLMWLENGYLVLLYDAHTAIMPASSLQMVYLPGGDIMNIIL